MRRPKRLITVTALMAMAGAATAVGGAAQASTMSATPSSKVTVVVSHLSNPRGLAWSDGKLYVAQGGRASSVNCVTDPAGNTNCASLTGSIDVVDSNGSVTKLVSALISVGGPGGIAASGPAAVSVDNGQVYAVLAGNTVGIPPGGFPAWLLKAAHQELGQFGVVDAGALRTLSPVGDADYQWAAKHRYLVPAQFPDSNPNGLLVDGGTMYVADAGANALASVRPDGSSHVVAFFPAPKGSVTDAVATCVTKGPDGAFYVGELLGGTFAPGGARVWRVAIDHGKVTKSIWASGLTTIQGCGFDRWGNFYATEFEVNGLNLGPTASPLGAVVKISPDKHRTVLGMGQLFWPSGFAAGGDGSIYVSNCSIAPFPGFGPCPNGGQIVRIG